MKKMKKALCTALAVLTVATGASLPSAVSSGSFDSKPGIVQMIDANAATDVRRGRFNNNGCSWTGYTYIYATQGRNWRGQWYNKTPKVKLCTFDAMGWRSGGTMLVEVCTSYGKYIGTYKVKSGSKLTLPGGYSGYKIRIARYIFNYGNSSTARIRASADNFSNSGACQMWSIDASTNCYF